MRIMKGGERVNGFKISLDSLTQFSTESVSVKKDDRKSDAFSSVMKQSTSKQTSNLSTNTNASNKAEAFQKGKTVEEADETSKKVDDFKQLESNSENKFDSLSVSEQKTDDVISSAQKMDEDQNANIVEVTTEDTTKSKMSFDLLKDAKTFLEQLEDKLQSIVKKDSNLDEKDIQTMLEQMGISMTDLFDVSKLQQFVLQNAGKEVTALLTDEKLALQFQQLLTDVKELGLKLEQQFGISSDDVKELVTYVNQNQTETEVENLIQNETESLEPVLDDKIENILKKVSDMLKSDYKKDLNENISNTEEQTEEILSVLEDNDFEDNGIRNNFLVRNQEKVFSSSIENIQDNVEKSIKQMKVETESQTKDNLSHVKLVVEAETDKSQGESFNERDSERQPQTDSSQLGQFIENLAQVKLETEEVFSNKAEQLQQMKEIVAQVVEQIKIIVKEDMSSMEMQLNPENLGKVNLSVVSKNGQMTANFVTENEMAKNALESQMQQLKDNLQAQGLKVDAIEVAVSDFKFEQNSNMNEEQQKQQSENKKKASRKIDLSMLKDGLNDLSEEEALSAKVMIDNGNTVDYTA